MLQVTVMLVRHSDIAQLDPTEGLPGVQQYILKMKVNLKPIS